MTSYFIYTLCLLLIYTPVFLKGHMRIIASKPHLENPTSYESLLPFISSKLAHRTAVLHENPDDQQKLLSLFTNTKNEVEDAEVFLSEMLRVLKNLFAKKPEADTSKQKSNGGQSIAWSYYDDLGK